MATDFENYPKYHLDKHGRIVQQILNNAENVFGMAPSGNNVPTIQSTVGGGQHIINDNNRRAIFGDDFVNDNMGGIEIGHAGDGNIKVAVANYATEDDIKEIFNISTDPTELEQNFAPQVTIENGIVVIKLYNKAKEQYENITNPAATKLYYQITKTYPSSVSETYLVVGMASEIMDFTPTDSCITKVGIIVPGDLVNTSDSNPTDVYFINPGIPVYSTVDTNKYKISNTTPHLLNSANCFDYTLKYSISTYKYNEGGNPERNEAILTADNLEITLTEGQELEAYYEVTFKTELPIEPTYLPAYTIICQSKLKLNNYKKLKRPVVSCGGSTTLDYLIFEHSSFIEDSNDVAVDQSYVYSIQRTTDTTWSPDYYITTNTGNNIINDRVVIANTDLKLVAGDLIRVKSVAKNYYIDSTYTYFVIPVFDDNSGDVDEDLEVDLIASGIASAELYTPTLTDWTNL